MPHYYISFALGYFLFYVFFHFFFRNNIKRVMWFFFSKLAYCQLLINPPLLFFMYLVLYISLLYIIFITIISTIVPLLFVCLFFEIIITFHVFRVLLIIAWIFCLNNGINLPFLYLHASQNFSFFYIKIIMALEST